MEAWTSSPTGSAYYTSAMRHLFRRPSEGRPPSAPRHPDDFNDEAPALHSEQTLCSNPAVSNVHVVIYSLFTIFRRLSEGTALSAPQPPYDRFPYGLVSPADAYARGLRKMLTLPPLTSEFVVMASYAPTSFHELMDDKDESDGSSIGDVAPSHCLSQECAMADTPG